MVSGNRLTDLEKMCAHLHLDRDAESADPTVLAFMAPPEGSPPYHGFGVTDIEIDGFRLGAISNFYSDPASAHGGDGFVIAPDGARAGLVWKLDTSAYVFRTVEPDAVRWGVWLAGVEHAMTGTDAAHANFEVIVALLRPHWEAWSAGTDAPT